MAPKRQRLKALPGLANQGRLTDFHTGIIHGLTVAHEYTSGNPLSQVAIAELLGCSRATVSDHQQTAADLLAVALEQIDQRRLGQVPAEDTEEAITIDKQRRLKAIEAAAKATTKAGFRKYRSGCL